MKGTFVKSDDVLKLLRDGWMIYTRRGSAPYNPVYFHLYMDGEERRAVHWRTVQSLIERKLITGTDSIPKYSLINP